MAKTSVSAEQFIAVVPEHWVKYVRLVLVYLLLLLGGVVCFYVAGLTAYHQQWVSGSFFLFGLFLILVDHHWFFMAALSQVENHIIITTTRIIWIRHRLFFDEEMLEYSFVKMKSVEAKKTTLLQYIFQYGTIKFESGTPIAYVPHPNAVVRTIEQAMGMN